MREEISPLCTAGCRPQSRGCICSSPLGRPGVMLGRRQHRRADMAKVPPSSDLGADNLEPSALGGSGGQQLYHLARTSTVRRCPLLFLRLCLGSAAVLIRSACHVGFRSEGLVLPERIGYRGVRGCQSTRGRWLAPGTRGRSFGRREWQGGYSCQSELDAGAPVWGLEGDGNEARQTAFTSARGCVGRNSVAPPWRRHEYSRRLQFKPRGPQTPLARCVRRVAATAQNHLPFGVRSWPYV